MKDIQQTLLNNYGVFTFNNGAMFTLFVLTMFQVRHGKFWEFSLGYGVMLLALAELSPSICAAVRV